MRLNTGLTAVPHVQMDAQGLAVEWAQVLLWQKGTAPSTVARGTVGAEGVAEGGGEEQLGSAAGSKRSCHSAILPFCRFIMWKLITDACISPLH